jgi:hypothetical protein
MVQVPAFTPPGSIVHRAGGDGEEVDRLLRETGGQDLARYVVKWNQPPFIVRFHKWAGGHASGVPDRRPAGARQGRASSRAARTGARGRGTAPRVPERTARAPLVSTQ